MTWKMLASAVLFTSLSASIAQAQNSAMPPQIAGKLQELGRVIDPPKTAPLYAPMQEKEPYAGVKIQRDVKYGPDDLNTLDIFTPEGGSSYRPLLIFVHGGGFVAGSKHAAGSPFYDNIMLWAVKSGFVGVSIDYRLAPQAQWPAAAEDVATAVQWVMQNAARNGADPDLIFLMGHSAGATHVASYVSHPEFYKAKNGGLAGVVLLSGIYDLTAPDALGDKEQAYFGTDTARYAEQSALKGLLDSNIPLMAVAAELDPPRFVASLRGLREASCQSPRGCIGVGVLPEHSHMSEVYSINTDDARLTGKIFEFVEKVSEKRTQPRSARIRAQ